MILNENLEMVNFAMFHCQSVVFFLLNSIGLDAYFLWSSLHWHPVTTYLHGFPGYLALATQTWLSSTS